MVSRYKMKTAQYNALFILSKQTNNQTKPELKQTQSYPFCTNKLSG